MPNPGEIKLGQKSEQPHGKHTWHESRIENIGGVFKLLKQHLIDWKYHISYVFTKLLRNTGVISKLRHYLPLKQLTDLRRFILILSILTFRTLLLPEAAPTRQIYI